ncbi:hypothetical protein CA264_20375 [Pontibacter actiniarum]|uniref:Uncharacterized protein n=1 Tax=Pontibacter actiniarum TaxID=323450 RepID=A0A1X9YXN7_9BACT|nr:hypothetical protein CA264_20375 [Pontibacter actiniarum]
MMSSLQLDWLEKPSIQLNYKTAFLAQASACATGCLARARHRKNSHKRSPERLEQFSVAKAEVVPPAALAETFSSSLHTGEINLKQWSMWGPP